MLIGEYQVALGDKNRIALPKRLRDELGDALVISRGYDGCGLLLDKTRWEALLAQIGSGSLFRLNARDTKRYLLGGAVDVELDKQGRFVVPEYMLTHIAADREIVFLGVGDWVEIWSSEKWFEKAKYLSTNASDIAERLINSVN